MSEPRTRINEELRTSKSRMTTRMDEDPRAREPRTRTGTDKKLKINDKKPRTSEQPVESPQQMEEEPVLLPISPLKSLPKPRTTSHKADHTRKTGCHQNQVDKTGTSVDLRVQWVQVADEGDGQATLSPKHLIPILSQGSLVEHLLLTDEDKNPGYL